MADARFYDCLAEFLLPQQVITKSIMIHFADLFSLQSLYWTQPKASFVQICFNLWILLFQNLYYLFSLT